MNNAMNNGDAELISKAIDEFVQPDVLIRTPLPVEAAGGKHSSRCGRCSFARSPTFMLRSRT